MSPFLSLVQIFPQFDVLQIGYLLLSVHFKLEHTQTIQFNLLLRILKTKFKKSQTTEDLLFTLVYHNQ